jgi:hypothetical protein
MPSASPEEDNLGSCMVGNCAPFECLTVICRRDKTSECYALPGSRTSMTI